MKRTNKIKKNVSLYKAKKAEKTLYKDEFLDENSNIKIEPIEFINFFMFSEVYDELELELWKSDKDPTGEIGMKDWLDEIGLEHYALDYDWEKWI